MTVFSTMGGQAVRLYLTLTSPGVGLNDGQWHSVSLTVKRNQLRVTLDHDGAASIHATLPVGTGAGDTYRFGGEWGAGTPLPLTRRSRALLPLGQPWHFPNKSCVAGSPRFQQT